MRSQTRSEISNSIVDLLLRSANSDFSANEVFPEALDELGSIEALRFQNFQLATFRIWENIHYQWRHGLYEDPEFEAEKQIWAKNINYPSMRRLFCNYRSALEPSFADVLNSLLEKPC